MTQFTTSAELDSLPDDSVILLATNGNGIAAQKLDGMWFVVGADPHRGQTAAEMASHAPRYSLEFGGDVLYPSENSHLRRENARLPRS